MNTKELEILTNIIGAVESGGQIYGNRDYAAYAAPYTNSPIEHTCTLGWAQNYGDEARKLCQMIYDEDKEAFKKADTGGIAAKLNVDWVATRWKPNNAEKQALIAIITTNAGKKCQDLLFMQLMEQYIKQALAFDSTMSVQSQMMWCEIQHLGGIGAVKRIYNRAVKPYTPDTVFASLMKDQQDKSNDNQVGDKKFQSRHEKCVQWIKQYVDGGAVMGVTVEDILKVARGWIGYSESNGRWWSIVNGVYNNYVRKTGQGRGYCLSTTDAWCDAFVSSCFIQANAVSIIGEVECGVPNHIQIFKDYGIWRGLTKPKAGWIVCFDWQNGRSEWGSDHIGLIESIDADGNIVTIEGNYKDAVGRRYGLKWNAACITGYAQPNYSKSKPEPKPEPTPEPTPTVDYAESFDKSLAGAYTVTASALNLRAGAGTSKPILKVMPNGAKVQNYGYYTKVGNTKWLYIVYNGITGFASKKYLQKA